MDRTTYITKHAQRVREYACMADTQATLTVNARAILAEGETIASAVWESDSVESVAFVSGSIDSPATTAIIKAVGCGTAMIRCQLTTSEGVKVPQYILVRVSGGQFDQSPGSTTSKLELTP